MVPSFIWETGSTRSRTDSDGLDLDTFFDVGVRGFVSILVLQHALAAERVDESGSAYSRQSASARHRRARRRAKSMPNKQTGKRTSSRGAADHQAELNSLLHVLLPSDHLLRGDPRSAVRHRE